MENTLSSVRLGAAERGDNLRRLEGGPFDLLVIGGGVTGAAVALDAALRGFRTALLEKGDYGVGTSSRSSKLIHGGLRYLEQLDFGLVFEALREREVLINVAPHLITPELFLFPLYEDGRTGPLRLRLGLFLYDLLAGFRSIGRRVHFETDRVEEVEPLLRRAGLRALAGYYDAVTNDARHTLTVVRSAAAAGATVVNYTRVIDLLRDADGRVIGVHARDELHGRDLEVRAHVTANATGVWAGRLLERADEHLTGLLHPSKGSHLVLDRERLPVRQAMIFESPLDGRVMFVIPWGWFTLVGTTEVEFDGSPDAVYASVEEVDYLLESVRGLFPDLELRRTDVVATFAGLRPLVAEAGQEAGTTSREHSIFERPERLFTVVGGKYTTHRLMAEQLVDLAEKRLRREFGVGARSPCLTRRTPLVGAPARDRVHELLREVDEHARQLGLPDNADAHLVRRYGTEARGILARIDARPALGELLAPPLPYSGAEARFAAEMEMTLTLTDFMARRTHLIYAGGDDNRSVAERAARHLADALGWDEHERSRQLDAYQRERQLRRAPLQSPGPRTPAGRPPAC